MARSLGVGVDVWGFRSPRIAKVIKVLDEQAVREASTDAAADVEGEVAEVRHLGGSGAGYAPKMDLAGFHHQRAGRAFRELPLAAG